MDKPLVFAIRNYLGLKRDIVLHGAFDHGSVEVKVFADGEIFQEVETPVRGRNVALIAGTVSESDTLEAFDLACALVEHGARSLTIGIPFFGYSTMERAWKTGVAITAKSRARIWSSMPAAPSGNRIVLLEPHTGSLPHYFEGRHSVTALDAIPLILGMIRRLGGVNPVLCSPDLGRIKWVDRLSLETGLPSAFVLKRRNEDESVQALCLTENVRGRRVILCDDMVRTGGTLIQAAQSCLQAGASEIDAVAVHGAFTPGALENLQGSGLFRAVVCTDSHPNSYGRPPGWLDVESCAGLWSEYLLSPI